MLVPKRVKFRRVHRGHMRGEAKGGKKRGGKVWIKIFPHKSYTSKGVGVRMGNGKGAPEGWVEPVKRGKVMFEVGGVPEATAREALRLAQHKLPVRTKIVTREAE